MHFIVDNFSSGQVPWKSRTYTIYYIGSIVAVFSYNNIQYTVGTYLCTYMDMDYRRCIVIFHKHIIAITDILILVDSRIHSAN